MALAIAPRPRPICARHNPIRATPNSAHSMWPRHYRKKREKMMKIRVMKSGPTAVVALAASGGRPPAQAAGAAEGVSRRLCIPCHDPGAEAKVKLGPPLNGIDGRKAGTFEGYNYSPA